MNGDSIRGPFKSPEKVVIQGEDNRELLVIHRDGTVTGDIEDVSEAGARFVAYLREALGQTPVGQVPETQAVARALSWYAEKGGWLTPDEKYVRSLLTEDLEWEYGVEYPHYRGPEVSMMSEASARATVARMPAKWKLVRRMKAVPAGRWVRVEQEGTD